ncbi:MAG TPA: 30S ribosomal protein S18 [Gammaproteobacteria bacterium]|nr:30S ribosomal protein S18 [Gammaproteobacteria bacterium]
MAKRFRGNKKKFCPFAEGKIPSSAIDKTNVRFLRKFITDTGKIVPSRITGVSAKYQHAIVREIKHARFLALLPYCDRH